ncbi:MAG: ParB/RepB/Spo0J family partition protein [Thermoproteota archaeon]|nr:ParB/RepB/Spo0J family partition protein [Thermoproteota archaeon]
MSDQDSLSELALSVKNVGLLEPIIVRPLQDGYEIISGHRRYEAFKLLGMTRITCHIVDVDDKEAYEMSLIENLQQKSMNPLEEASAFKKYVHTFGWGGESDLAKRIGKGQEYVCRRIRLLQLPLSAQQKILNKEINASLAQELYALDEEQIEKVIEDVAVNRYSNKEAREMVRTIRRNPDFASELPSPKEQYGLSSTLASAHSRADMEADAKERAEYLFKKCVISTRIALKSFDNVLNDVEEESNKDEFIGDYFWAAKELVMQYRITLHGLVDSMIKNQKKFTKLERIVA